MIKKLKELFTSIIPSESKPIQKLLFIASLFLFFAYCFSIPMFAINMHYIPIIICGLMCLLMGLYTFFYGKFKINLLIALLILFNIAIFITHIINLNLSLLPKTIVLMSVVAFFVYEFLSSTKKANVFLVTLLVAGLIFGLIYILKYRSEIFNFSSIFSKRLGSDFDNENEISKEFGFFCVVSVAFLLKNKKVVLKVLCGLSVVFFLFLILTTGSISNLLTTTVVCFLTVLFCQKKIKTKLIMGGVALGVVALFVILLQLPFMAYFKTRIGNIFSTIFSLGKENYDGSTYDRFSATLTSFGIGFNRIMFGFGYMSATSFTNNYIQAHNNFAELFLDFGLVGVVIYEAVVFIPLSKEKKFEDRYFVLPIMLYMFVFQLFLTTYYKKFEYIFLAYVFALLDDNFRGQFVVYHSNCLRKEHQKKVIFEVIPSIVPVGGAETFLIDFIESCKKRYSDEFDIKLIVLYKNGIPDYLKEKLNGVEIIEIGKDRGLDISCACGLRSLIFEYKPVIIHTHLFALSTLKIALPFRKRNIKCYHTIHHNFPGVDNNQKLLKYLVKRDYLTPVCVADVPTEEYAKYLGKKPICIPNGIDLNNYKNEKPLSSRDIDFLLVGRFVEVKNQKYVLELLRNNEALQKYKFTFLGDGPLLEESKEYATSNNLTNIVNFAGFVQNANEYMSNAKVLVMPSLNEGNPIVINEAFASGMLVVGNNVGGIKDLIASNENGDMTSIYNKRDFANKMLSQIEKANKTKKIIKQDNSKISIDYCVDNYLHLFGVIK